MKIKIENKNYLNFVINLNENNIDNENLDLIKLINNCKQIKKTNNEKRKISELSDIIYIIIDRIILNKNKGQFNLIYKEFKIKEIIFYNNNLGSLSENGKRDSFSYELKFIIIHSSNCLNSGHYTAYSKIKGE